MLARTRSYALRLGKFALAFGLLFWLFKSGRIDVSAFRVVLAPAPLLVCSFLLAISFFLTTLRWQLLLATQGFRASLINLYRLTLIGLFFNFALPGGVSGDVVKAYYLMRKNRKARSMVAVSVVVDRFIGMGAMAAIALVMMMVDFARVKTHSTLKAIFIFVALLCLGLLVVGGVLFSRRIFRTGFVQRFLSVLPKGDKLIQLFRRTHEFGRDRRQIVLCFLMSLLSQFSSFFVFIYIGHLLNETLPWISYFICLPIGLTVTAVPVAPGGVGVGQAAFYFLFNLYQGYESNFGPTLATIYQVLTLIFGMIGAVLFVVAREEGRHAKRSV